MRIDNNMVLAVVLAAFSLAQFANETRGLNEYEKKLVREMFESLPFDDFNTRTYITGMYGELFNKVMS